MRQIRIGRRVNRLDTTEAQFTGTDRKESPMPETLSDKKVVRTDKAAEPIGPYSQAIVAGGFVFVAGEKGINPRTGEMAPGIQAQTRQTLENIRVILEAAGSSLDRAVATTVYLVDIEDFASMNEVYAEYFVTNPPGRTTVAVSALPAGALVEIQCTALAP
jgi:2-iminobutanoate/2-iminopropanoate deaminase